MVDKLEIHIETSTKVHNKYVIESKGNKYHPYNKFKNEQDMGLIPIKLNNQKIISYYF